MFTWISKSSLFTAFAGIFLLAGCLGEVTGGAGANKAQRSLFKAPILEKVEVFQGAVIVAGPKGYCIDRQSLRRSRDGAFVLIASCASLTGKSDTFVDPAVLTVSVLPAKMDATRPTAAELAVSAGSSELLRSEDRNGISLVQIANGGDRIWPDGDARYWRASIVINGHIVGLAVYGPKGSGVAGEGGRQLLIALAQQLRRLSPVTDLSPQ